MRSALISGALALLLVLALLHLAVSGKAGEALPYYHPGSPDQQDLYGTAARAGSFMATGAERPSSSGQARAPATGGQGPASTAAADDRVSAPGPVEAWATSGVAQALVGSTLGELRAAYLEACPTGSLEVDHPGGPMKKRGPAADRLIVNADGDADDATVERIWGHFPELRRDGLNCRFKMRNCAFKMRNSVFKMMFFTRSNDG